MTQDRSPKEYLSCSYDSPVGTLTLAATDEGLKGLWIEDQKYYGMSIAGEMTPGENEHLASARRWLDAYFAGENPSIGSLTLAPEGSPFRQVVWDLLCEIPLGSTTTYGALAKQAAKRLKKRTMSAQATGGAVGHNPISIIIPCHRVLGSDGSLTGYAGGLDRKIQLLNHEGVEL